MTMVSYESYLRGQNHFIRYDRRVGWVLIGGPWYEKLYGCYEKNHVNVIRLVFSYPIPFRFAENDLPKCMKVEAVVWEVVKWHPGRLKCETVVNHIRQKHKDDRISLRSWCDYIYYDRYVPWANLRVRIGFRFCRNGVGIVPIGIRGDSYEYNFA